MAKVSQETSRSWSAGDVSEAETDTLLLVQKTSEYNKYDE
jgi:hypothetical protein